MNSEDGNRTVFHVVFGTGKKLCITIDRSGSNFFCQMQGEENSTGSPSLMGDILLRVDKKGHWWIDIIKMTPTRQGYGSLFLQAVLTSLKIHPSAVRVFASSEDAVGFFFKNRIGHIETDW